MFKKYKIHHKIKPKLFTAFPKIVLIWTFVTRCPVHMGAEIIDEICKYCRLDIFTKFIYYFFFFLSSSIEWISKGFKATITCIRLHFQYRTSSYIPFWTQTCEYKSNVVSKVSVGRFQLYTKLINLYLSTVPLTHTDMPLGDCGFVCWTFKIVRLFASLSQNHNP